MYYLLTLTRILWEEFYILLLHRLWQINEMGQSWTAENWTPIFIIP